MKAQNNARQNGLALKTEIDNRIQDLARLTDEAARSDAMKAYLDICARFHHYSPYNQLLIGLTRPNATLVAGYKAWMNLKRFVKKGEKGIAILAPSIYRSDPDDESSPKVLKGFRVVYVFDVAQTDGKPLPEAPNWKSPVKNQELQEKLITFAKTCGVHIWTKELVGETQGISMGGKIELSPEAGTKTLIHELAHELLHHGDESREFSRENRELEAEAIAYVVASHFSLADLSSPNYLALWDADSGKILARMDRIRNTATEIIDAVQQQSELSDN